MSQIPDIFPVLAAASKTLLAKSRESLTTRTPHSELVYNYSGSKHVSVSLVSILSLKVFFWLNSLSFWHEKISESLKRCGISENSTYILVARFAASADEVRWHNHSLFASFCFWFGTACHVNGELLFSVDTSFVSPDGSHREANQREGDWLGRNGKKSRQTTDTKGPQISFSDKEFDLLLWSDDLLWLDFRFFSTTKYQLQS